MIRVQVGGGSSMCVCDVYSDALLPTWVAIIGILEDIVIFDYVRK